MGNEVERAPIATWVAVAIGAIAALIGGASLIGFGDRLRELADLRDVGGSAAAGVAGEALLVGAETLACGVFLALTVGLVALHGAKHWRMVAASLAALKIGWLLLSVATHWKPGWYYILDPIGDHATARGLFFASIGQALALAVAAARRG